MTLINVIYKPIKYIIKSVKDVLYFIFVCLRFLIQPGTIVGLYIVWIQATQYSTEMPVREANEFLSATLTGAGVMTAIVIAILFSDNLKADNLAIKNLWTLSCFSMLSFVFSLILFYLSGVFESNGKVITLIVLVPEFCLIVSLYSLMGIMGKMLRSLKKNM